MYTFKCSSLGQFFRTMVGFNRVWVLVLGSGSESESGLDPGRVSNYKTYVGVEFQNKVRVGF